MLLATLLNEHVYVFNILQKTRSLCTGAVEGGHCVIYYRAEACDVAAILFRYLTDGWKCRGDAETGYTRNHFTERAHRGRGYRIARDSET